MYGGFWMSFGTIFIPGSGIIDSYITNGVLNAAELDSALGIYLWTWFIVTFLLLCVDRSLSMCPWRSVLPVSLSLFGMRAATLSPLRVSA